MAKKVPLPINTYIPWAESIARTNWYLKHKRPILDGIVHRYNPGHTERESFYYSDPRVISDLFGHVLGNEKYTGIRIYFGSCRAVIPKGCDVGDKGKLVLIYVPTIRKGENEKADNDSDEYYKLRPSSCSRETLAKTVLDKLVNNYQVDKRAILGSSLSSADLLNPNANEETKHLFMGRECISEIKTEIDYQLKMSDRYGASGIKVYINSYTDKPTRRDGHELRQRLTVQFVFTDDAGQDLNLERIDPRYKSVKPIALNTMNPTPPYP